MTPEAKARQQIDDRLAQAGWVVQDMKKLNLGASLGVAVREFPTDTGRGSFSVLERPDISLPDGMFAVATRRGKQFNSMVFSEIDPFTGAGRDAVYIDPADAGTDSEDSPLVVIGA